MVNPKLAEATHVLRRTMDAKVVVALVLDEHDQLHLSGSGTDAEGLVFAKEVRDVVAKALRESDLVMAVVVGGQEVARA